MLWRRLQAETSPAEATEHRWRQAMEGSAVLRKSRKDESAWRGFQPGGWLTDIDVRDFLVRNATPYDGDEGFLAKPSKRTTALWAKLKPYFEDEQKRGVLAV